MSTIKKEWDNARICYQQRYILWLKDYNKDNENMEAKGHLEECSYVLINFFGLKPSQVKELEQNDYCGLTNDDYDDEIKEKQANGINTNFMGNALYKQIGKKIQEVRKKKGLSQTELAELIGKSLRTIQKYESGEIGISIDEVHRIGKVLECSPGYLMGYEVERVRD